MKRATVVVALFSVAMAGATGGYWLGFRHAWQRALMAEAPVRGAIAIHQLRALDQGQSDNLRISFESDIDSGLMWWAQLEDFPLFDAINTLSGQAVTPDVEKYVRRLATYRKGHESPLRDPVLIANIGLAWARGTVTAQWSNPD